MSREQIDEKKFYVVHTKSGYWVGAYIFSEQLRHAKIYTSLHYANETAERLNRGDPNQFCAKILEVKICLADEEAGYRKQEWISVDERLPERNGRYLTHCNIAGQSLVCILHYSKVGGFNEGTVTHWMPLPEPPEKVRVTAESAIKAVQETAHKLRGIPPDDSFGISSTMQF